MHCAALVFTGSLDEVKRLGVMGWLESEQYKSECEEHVVEWGKTMWTMWKALSNLKSCHSDLYNKVPKEIAEMECWKAWNKPEEPMEDEE